MSKVCCPITGVNIIRFLVAVIVGFVFVFGFDFVFHALLLEDQYKETAHLWRPQETMEMFFPVAMASQLAYVTAMALVFTRNYEGKGIGEGFRFGILIGILMGVAQFGIYPYMPIPLTLALAWLAGTLVQCTVLGVIFSLLYRK